jgi:hypothetical protein
VDTSHGELKSGLARSGYGGLSLRLHNQKIRKEKKQKKTKENKRKQNKKKREGKKYFLSPLSPSRSARDDAVWGVCVVFFDLPPEKKKNQKKKKRKYPLLSDFFPPARRFTTEQVFREVREVI